MSLIVPVGVITDSFGFIFPVSVFAHIVGSIEPAIFLNSADVFVIEFGVLFSFAAVVLVVIVGVLLAKFGSIEGDGVVLAVVVVIAPAVGTVCELVVLNCAGVVVGVLVGGVIVVSIALWEVLVGRLAIAVVVLLVLGILVVVVIEGIIVVVVIECIIVVVVIVGIIVVVLLVGIIVVVVVAGIIMVEVVIVIVAVVGVSAIAAVIGRAGIFVVVLVADMAVVVALVV